MRVALLVAVGLFVLGACASTQRTLSYPATWPDADVMVGAERYQIWFHETDATLLIQRGDPRPLGQLLASNYTIHAVDRSASEPVWRAAGDAVLGELGCAVTEVRGADQVREASFACVGAVDVRSAVVVNRERWRRGVMAASPSASPPQ
jgi:hypothetical protein